MDFINENALFIDTYGTILCIILLIINVFLGIWAYRNKNKIVKWSLIFALLIWTFSIGTFLFLVHSPFKPVVKSLAKVQHNIGKPISNFTFKNVSTGSINSISDYEGNVILLNFWGTYCGPCIEEFPDLKKIETTYPNSVSVIALSDEKEERILKFLKRVEGPSIVGHFTNEKWLELENFRPLTIVLDKKGVVQHYIFGKKDYNHFKTAIEPYLN